METKLFYGGRQRDLKEIANGYYQLFTETEEPEYGQGKWNRHNIHNMEYVYGLLML